MIDWMRLGANLSWILGISLSLAAISIASWEAELLHQGTAERLRKRGTRFSLNLAAVLFCLGLAGLSTEIWTMVIWLVLDLWFIIQSIYALR